MDAAGLSSHFQLKEVDGLEGLQDRLDKGREALSAKQEQGVRLDAVKQQAAEAVKGIAVEGQAKSSSPSAPPSSPALPEEQRKAQHGRG